MIVQSQRPSQTRMSKMGMGDSLQMSYTKHVSGQFNEWAAQVLQALYEMHPYVADYQPSLSVDKVNPEKGYLVGKVMIVIGDRKISIPLIVKSFEILPFAVFLSEDEAYPLNEERLATMLQALEPVSWAQDSQKEWEHVLQDQNIEPPDHYYNGQMGNRAVLNKISQDSPGPDEAAATDALFEGSDTVQRAQQVAGGMGGRRNRQDPVETAATDALFEGVDTSQRARQISKGMSSPAIPPSQSLAMKKAEKGKDPVQALLEQAEAAGKQVAQAMKKEKKVEKEAGSVLNKLSSVRREDYKAFTNCMHRYPGVQDQISDWLMKIGGEVRLHEGEPEVDLPQSFGAYQDTFLIEPTGPQRFHLTGTSARFRKMSHADCTRAQVVQLFGAGIAKTATKKGYAVVKVGQDEAQGDPRAQEQAQDREQRGIPSLISQPAMAMRPSALSQQMVTPTAGFEIPVRTGDKVGPIIKGANLQEVPAEHPGVIEETGMWGVRDKMGRVHVGAIFADVYNFGEDYPLPLKVFCNGSVSAVQEDIAGIHVGPMQNFPEVEEPEGECTFVFSMPENPEKMCCTVPFVVSAQVETPFGPGYLIETYLASKMTIINQAVMRPMQIEGDVWAVPESYRMIRMADPSGRTELLETPEVWDSMVKGAAGIEVLADGSGSFSLRGEGYHLPELEKRNVEHILVSLGATDVDRLLKKASFVGHIKLFGNIPPDQSGTIEAGVGKLLKHAHTVTTGLRFDADMIWAFVEKILNDPSMGDKLGSIDPETVDDVLSLGFVRPENTRMFLESEPTLERSVRQIARLTLASQMGYSKIPTRECIDAMEAMEKVLLALRKIRAEHQQKSF